MPPDNDELRLDRLIHEPARLAIMTVLSSVEAADFVFLARTTGLTNGNLSSHLTKLEDAGLVTIEKRFVRKKPNTNIGLTPEGRKRVATHWSQLERLKSLAKSQSDAPWRPPAGGRPGRGDEVITPTGAYRSDGRERREQRLWRSSSAE